MRTYAAAIAVLLAAAPTRASDVFLSLTRDPIPLADTPANVELIKAADFEKTTARTVADAIANEPGLVIQTVGSEGSLQTPMIRGFFPQQVLVVIDDVPQAPDLTGTVDLSRIPLDNVDRIEILRGSASAVYGPNAEGGVIHIITKRPTHAVDVQATSEAGSFHTYNNRIQAGTSQGAVQAQVTASRDLSDGFQQNSSYRNTDLTGFLAYDAKAWGKLAYTVEGAKGTLGLPSGTPVPISDWNGELERQANDLNAKEVETDRNNRLQYANRIGALDLTARAANNVEDLDAFQFGSETRVRTEGRNAFGKVELPGTGAAGYELYQRRLDSNVFGVHRGDAWGSFVEAYLIQKDWLHLTPGIRFDRDNTYGSSWSPRLQLVVKPGDIWKISASVARSFQAPTFSDLYDPFVPVQFQPSTLNPEITWSYDLGLAVKPAAGLDASVSVFYTDTRDRIALNPDEGFAAFNLDRAYSRGVETQLAYDVKALRQTISYSYLDARGKTAGTGYRTLQFTPKHKIAYRADARLPWQTTAT